MIVIREYLNDIYQAFLFVPSTTLDVLLHNFSLIWQEKHEFTCYYMDSELKGSGDLFLIP